jgi:hypothetical protein
VLCQFVGVARTLGIGCHAGVELFERAARLFERGSLPLGARAQVGVT